jgi:hypothetical protein
MYCSLRKPQTRVLDVLGGKFLYERRVSAQDITKPLLLRYYLELSRLLRHPDMEEADQLPDGPLLKNDAMASNLEHMSREDIMFVIAQLQARGAPPYPLATNTWTPTDCTGASADWRLPPYKFVILPSSIPGAGMGAYTFTRLTAPETKGALGMYKGALLNPQERTQVEQANSNVYLFSCTGPGGQAGWAIDAAGREWHQHRAPGSWLRFINAKDGDPDLPEHLRPPQNVRYDEAAWRGKLTFPCGLRRWYKEGEIICFFSRDEGMAALNELIASYNEPAEAA